MPFASMEFEAAQAIADSVLFAYADRHLSDIEIAILAGAWNGKTYEQIAEAAGYSPSYLTRTVGPQLWKLLSEALEEPVSKTNFRAALERRSRISAAVNDPQTSSPTSPFSLAAPSSPLTHLPKIDWGEIVDVSQFSGRETELELLQQWVERDSTQGRDNQCCRLVALLGIGGVGKSSLAAKLVQVIATNHAAGGFEYIIWRSLRNAPPLETLLSEVVLFLSDQSDTHSDLRRLLHWLRTHRCLVILDNVETILQPGDRAGHYRSDYEDYGELFSLIGESAHQSCLLLTSREKPAEVSMMEGMELGVRSLSLAGSYQVGTAILEAKGLKGTDEQKRDLCDRYSGNPLALKIVSSSIQDLFDGEIAPFIKQSIFLFNGINRLLEQQLERLSYLEKSILYWLTINREWTSISELLEDIVPPVSSTSLLEALESLSWRNLIEKRAGIYTLQPVIMEYVNGCLVERVSTELITGKLVLGDRHALIKTTVKEYIRESQARLILKPIAEQFRLAQQSGSKHPSKGLSSLSPTAVLKQQIAELLITLRSTETHYSGYGAGNLINLCFQLGLDLTELDFSHLVIWHANLQNQSVQRVNFAGATLDKILLTQSFGTIFSIAYHPNGKWLAVGSYGVIYMWDIHRGTQHLICTLTGHSNWVTSIAFSPDGKFLLSGSCDQTVRLWNLTTGELHRIFQGHTNTVWSVAFSPDGQALASSSEDQTVRLWHRVTGECAPLLGHAHWVSQVAFSPDGQTLASSSLDCTVRLWDVSSKRLLKCLEGHQDWVNVVAFSPDGNTLVSGSRDHTMHLWNVQAGTITQTFQTHSAVLAVAFSPDGQSLISGSKNAELRLWNLKTGQPHRILRGRHPWVTAVAVRTDGLAIASGSHNGILELWDVEAGMLVTTLRGYHNVAQAIAFLPTASNLDEGKLISGSSDTHLRLWNLRTGQEHRLPQCHTEAINAVAIDRRGQYLASGGIDQTIYLWDLKTGAILQHFTGHTNWIRSLAFCKSGEGNLNSEDMLASSSHDRTIRLWSIRTGETIAILEGHTNWVTSVSSSGDGRYLASGSDDATILLWEIATRQMVQVFRGHTLWVWSVAFSPDSSMIASGGEDQTIRLWQVETGEELNRFEGHGDSVTTIAFSPDQSILASGSHDCTVKLWCLKRYQLVMTLTDHESWITAIAFDPAGQILASASMDETIRLWDVVTGDCLKILRSDRPYEGMDITDVQGLTETQIKTLKALGAVDT